MAFSAACQRHMMVQYCCDSGSNDVINRFSQLRQKNKLSFFTFDIIDFYPSISDELLNKSMILAKKYTSIDDQEYETIMHSGKHQWKHVDQYRRKFFSISQWVYSMEPKYVNSLVYASAALSTQA